MIQYRNQGIVLGEDSEKMSKSRGNVVAPDELVSAYGADVVRAYLIFFARWNQGGPWNSSGIDGVYRWVKRVWSTLLEPSGGANAPAKVIKDLRRKLHQTIQSVTHDFEQFEFNTIVSSLMELMNEMVKARQDGAGSTPEWQEAVEAYLLMMAPVMPHVAEELWSLIGRPYSIHRQAWPKVDETAVIADEVELAIQVNGKLRDHITVPVDISEAEVRALVLEREAVRKHLEGKPPRKIIYIAGRLVNVVV